MKAGGRSFTRGTDGESKMGRLFLLDLRHRQAPSGNLFMSRDVFGRAVRNYGAAWTPQGHLFDGVDDYLDCGYANLLALTGDATWELHLKRLSYAYEAGIIGKSYDHEFDFRCYSSPNIVAYSGNGSSYDQVYSDDGVIDNNIAFRLAITRDTTTKKYRFFRNGNPGNEKPYTHTPASSSYIVTVARCNQGTGQALNAVISYVAISSFRQFTARILQRAISARKP